MLSNGPIQIGENVLQRRSALGLSQRELAAKAGTTAAAVSHIERGQRQPSGDMLSRLASALECSIDELVSAKHSSSPESIYLARVTSAMKSMPMKVQEQVADYCDFMKQKHRKGTRRR